MTVQVMAVLRQSRGTRWPV